MSGAQYERVMGDSNTESNRTGEPYSAEGMASSQYHDDQAAANSGKLPSVTL